MVSIPHGCEIVWGLITLKNATVQSLVRKIVVASIYVKPLSRKGKVLHDHIAETYHMLCAKYGDPLDFILAGDVNTWKVEPVLLLNNNFRQLVTQPTRHNPDAVLDVVLTTLGKYYQTPVIEDPLETDDGNAASDHMLVKVLPLNNFQNRIIKEKKTIQFRSYTEKCFKNMESKLKEVDWGFLANDGTANDNFQSFQDFLFNLFDECFPLKTRTVTNDSEPWYSENLSVLKRKKCREYAKHRKSEKYLSLEKTYKAAI